jgi:ABC-type phosphate transport system substrate-binding protein
MKSLMRSLVLLLATGLLAVALLGCSDSDGGSSSTSVNLANRLYVAAAESGTLTPTEKGSEFIITLNQVWTDVKWFTDRPERETGENTTTD